ncbi:M28 family peptidase [Halocatena pleomorpha]|uniref:Carboxypeptidase Q n=1 Tax=Halocatena pleomorpha TaxID=1785090 RepID=A0A3P3RHJ9_9EURY|nr:M28 family metallopeptidase [Halocatena pleomorpha]RRJ32825.1 M28 family peptidase [Halocatena pleomorpha]
MTDWIGTTFTSTVGWDHLERLVDIDNRMAGSDGEREAAVATREALTEVGARDVRLDAFDIHGWERQSSAVRAGGRHHESIALPRSPAESATGELVDLGYGLPTDFETDLSGSIVLVSSTVPEWYDRFIHRREKYYRAVDAGAAGFVFKNHIEGCLAPTGSVGTPVEPIGAIPAVGVSTEVGERLIRRFEDEQVTVDVTANVGSATSQNVHAVVGPDTDEEILVTSHLDAHDIAEGAMDNGMGTAMVVELAAALAMREDELETRVRFVAFGAEEVGLCGSEHEAGQADLDRIKAVVNNDGVARNRTISAFTHGFAGLADALDQIADRFDHPISKIPHQNPHSDHWPFVLAGGVPGLHLRSETKSRGRGWGHTRADTLDKLEQRTLRESAILVTELLVLLARDDTTLDHRPRSDIIAALRREDKAEGLALIGDLPEDESSKVV